MPSKLSWIDHSEEQRRRMLDVLELFREKNTVDELGVGTIRDALADRLFPATSTIHTRARYFFFIPWLYQRLERQKVQSAEIVRRARKAEVDLIERLVADGEGKGMIGRDARGSLQRLPSEIYWNALCRLGICVFDGSRDAYHRSLDRFYRTERVTVRTEDGELIGRARSNWHPGLVPPPDGFPDQATLTLTKAEAEYLRERIRISAPACLFAHLAWSPDADGDAEFPWLHPGFARFSERIKRVLSHARNFSEVMRGAILLYNLLLAELKQDPDRISEYRDQLSDWADELEHRLSDLDGWDRKDFWFCVEEEGARIGMATRGFVERWWHLALDRRHQTRIADTAEARDLVAHRERALKGALARVDNTRARDTWGGASGTAQLAYRWDNARRILLDIAEGLGSRHHA